MMTDRGAKALAAAIVAQAVRDWYGSQGIIGHGERPKTDWDNRMRKHPESIRDDAERFLLSDWMTVITDLDGALLLRMMKAGPHMIFASGGAVRNVGNIRKRARSWQRMNGYPELQQALLASGIQQNEIAHEMGMCKDHLTVWLRKGLTPDQAEKIRQAMLRIEGRREQ